MSDTPNTRLMYAKAIRDFLLRMFFCQQLSNLSNLILSQLSIAVSFASFLPNRSFSVFERVSKMVGARQILKIFESVIGLVQILVADIEAFWAWADKRSADERMHRVRFLIFKFNRQISTAIYRWREKKRNRLVQIAASFGLIRPPNASERRHFIKSFVSDNREPLFHTPLRLIDLIALGGQHG